MFQDVSDDDTIESEVNVQKSEGKAGFTLCFDNVNIRTTARSYSSEHGNTQYNMVQSLAALNRITSEGLSSQKPEAKSILEVRLASFYPSEEDIRSMKEDIKV